LALDRGKTQRQNQPMARVHPFQVAVVLGATLATAPVFAQSLDGGRDGENFAAPPAERRDGFMASLGYNVGYGAIGGYPNKLGQIDNPGYYSEITGLGTNLSLVLGGALRDWLTAGLLIRAGGVTSDEKVVGGSTGIGLHIEGFPLWARGGPWRNIALTGEFGVGVGYIADTTDQKDPLVLADGGAMSHLAVGAAWEVWKFWLFSAGPAVQYTYQYSNSLSAHLATAGMKLTFYWNQPR
jgi:hypothetical protein